jgi:hypothetical protein
MATVQSATPDAFPAAGPPGASRARGAQHPVQVRRRPVGYGALALTRRGFDALNELVFVF